MLVGRASLLVAVLLAGLGSVSGERAAADEPPAAAGTLRPEDRAFFAWWDSLEYPDVGRLPFVEFTTGGGIVPLDDSDRDPDVEHGFLLSEEAGTARVFVPDLGTWIVVLREVPGQRWQSIRVSRANLEAFVTRGLASVPADGGSP